MNLGCSSWLERHQCCMMTSFLFLLMVVFGLTFSTSLFLSEPTVDLYPELPLGEDFLEDYEDLDIGDLSKILNDVAPINIGPVNSASDDRTSKLATEMTQRTNPSVRPTTSSLPDSLFIGLYEHVKDKNFEGLLQQLDIGFFIRKTILLTRPSVEIDIEHGGNWTILTHLPFKTLKYEFKLGKPVLIRNPSKETESVFTLEKNKLIQTPVDESGELKIERIFLKNKMITKLHHIPSGTEALRFFKKNIQN